MRKNLTQSGSSGPWDGHMPSWIAAAVILGSGLMLAGAIISRLEPTLLSDGPMTPAARVYADYLFARNLPLALMMLALLAMRSRRMLAGLMVLTACIQSIDVLDNLVRADYVLVPGLLVFAIVFLAGASRLFGEAPWHAAPWRDDSRREA